MESRSQMIIPNSYEELAQYVESGKHVFFFTADWCGDCSFIKPSLPKIEEKFPQFCFVEVNRDQFLDLVIQWNIIGIPSLVVIEEGCERGRLVNKSRKSKNEIIQFLEQI